MNIHGNLQGLVYQETIHWLNTFDIVFLQELKCDADIHVPGYFTIRSLKSCKGQSTRGGTAVLIKWHLENDIFHITKLEDQVWFKLMCMPDLAFGACYIPPNDSPYNTNESFATIQEQCNQNKQIILIGDLNARMPQLNDFSQDYYSYSENPDKGKNANGDTLYNLCKAHNLMPLNHLKNASQALEFEGKLTFRRKVGWISQLDWAICSRSFIDEAKSLYIHQDIPLKSDHAAIEIIIRMQPTTDFLKTRAHQLVNEHVECKERKKTTKPIRVNPLRFQANLPCVETIKLKSTGQSTETILEQIPTIINEAASHSRSKIQDHQNNAFLTEAQRWTNLLNTNDHKRIWNAIGWNGSISENRQNNEKPTDEQFATFYGELLNSNPKELTLPLTNIYIPILDHPISVVEVDLAIKEQKRDKAAGPDTLYPGYLKLLPDSWIPFLAELFNDVFFGQYPQGWQKSITTMLYKKGDQLDPSNFRGISISPALANLYDRILSNRLMLWYKPHVSQAGAQRGRSCSEQVMVLRTLIDIAHKTKRKLYILFIDYKKAYDCVNRQKLINLLASKGCGTDFLRAVTSALSNTSTIIGSAHIGTSNGVKQGTPSSCPMFTFLLDYTSDMLQQLPNDNWLESLHALMYMDDTVLLATSRQQMLLKVTCLLKAATEINMTVHPAKSKFISINCKDRDSFIIDDVEIRHTDQYSYLGSLITAETLSKQVKKEINGRLKQTFKFSSFLKKNPMAPFTIKTKVWTSAVQSTILYTCESWMTNTQNMFGCVVNRAVKEMLGVRQQTPNNLALVESGLSHMMDIIETRQINFLQKLRRSTHFQESPLKFALNLAQSVRAASTNYLAQLPQIPGNRHLDRVKQEIRSQATTRNMTYLSINTALTPNPANNDRTVEETKRIASCRFRLSSHYLAVEKGRWQRIPHEQRLCDCGVQGVQDEHHVITICEKTKHIRQEHPDMTFIDLDSFLHRNSNKQTCDIIYKILELFNQY